MGQRPPWGLKAASPREPPPQMAWYVVRACVPHRYTACGCPERAWDGAVGKKTTAPRAPHARTREVRKEDMVEGM